MSALTEFRQHAIAALGMYKGNSCSMCAITRYFVDHPGSLSYQPGNGGLKVFHLVGQVVDTGAIPLDELCHRAVR